MDLQSALVCGLVFVVSAAILLLISMFGIKEKSYEEALAEQKKLTSGLLGTGQKPKPKEKKQKKAGKKVKEKTTTNVEREAVEEVVSSQPVSPVAEVVPDVPSHSKLHVEFEPDPAVLEQPQTSKVGVYYCPIYLCDIMLYLYFLVRYMTVMFYFWHFFGYYNYLIFLFY